MTLAQYRTNPALNFSFAKHLLRSPAHYRAALMELREETPAMRLGTLTHTMILEPEKMPRIAIKPDGMSFSKKEGKAWRADNAAREILTPDEWDAITGMSASVFAHTDAAALLAGCSRRETPLLANLRGVDCKALIDAHGYSTDASRHVIVDIKTTDDASQEAFARKVTNYHYDMQAAWYQMVLTAAEQAEEEPLFYWVVVEKSPPYAVAVYDASDWTATGTDKALMALEIYERCKRDNDWPQPWPGVRTLYRPAWAVAKGGFEL